MARQVRVPPGPPAAPPPSPYEVPGPGGRAAELARLRARYPAITAWYGEATGHWWAVLPAPGRRGRLIEAATPAGLEAAIARAQGRSRPNR